MLPWRPMLCVLLPFAAGYYLSYLFRSINALIAGDLAAELGLTAADLGFLTAIYFLVFAAVQLPFGVLLDRCGPRLIQSALLLVAGVGALVFALADGVVTLMLGRALIGLGVALALMAGLKAIVLWFPPQRLALANGWFIMLGALGALTATGPAEVIVQSLGWRGLFALLAAHSAGAALLILIVVPDGKQRPAAARPHPVNVWAIYQDRRFWKIAPLSAIGIGTSWSLQGLWAAPWLADVAGLDRTAVVQHLTAMAAALAAAALLLGALADRLRCTGIPTEIILAGTLGLSMAAQLALLLGLPVPSHLLWIIIAAAGAATVLSFAILAQYFPKEASGRANAALGVLHVGAAFALQSLAGFIIGQWPQTDGHYPAEAHQAAMAVGIGLQLVTLGWFLTVPRRRPQTSMADAVTRMLDLDPPPVLVPAEYRPALSAWTQHIEHARRHARAWRFAAVGSGVLCAGLAAALSLTLPRPAIALHIIDSGNFARADPTPAMTDAARPIRGPNLLEAVHSAVAAPFRPELRAEGMECPLRGDRCALVPVGWWQQKKSANGGRVGAMNLTPGMLDGYPIRTSEKLRFADTDRNGHITNSVFAVCCQNARMELLCDPRRVPIPSDTQFVVARLVLEFRAEMHWPGIVEIGTRIDRIGRSSVMLSQALFVGDACVATSESLVVLIAATTRRPTPLPPQVVEALYGMAALNNHAGVGTRTQAAKRPSDSLVRVYS